MRPGLGRVDRLADIANDLIKVIAHLADQLIQMAGEEMIGIGDNPQINLNAALGLNSVNKADNALGGNDTVTFTMDNKTRRRAGEERNLSFPLPAVSRR